MADPRRWTQDDLDRHLARLKPTIRSVEMSSEAVKKSQRPRKYKNTPTLVTFKTGEIVRGILQICHVFDSAREAKRYAELHALAQSGGISDLELQPAYDLIVNGQTIGQYVGDFRYLIRPTGQFVLEDVKGMAGLPLYRWKVKHLKAQYAIEVVEVR